MLILIVTGSLVLFFRGDILSWFAGEPGKSLSETVGEKGDKELYEDTFTGMVKALGEADAMEKEEGYARDPLVYIGAFWEHIVHAPEGTSFFRRIINFILAVRGKEDHASNRGRDITCPGV